MGRGKTAIKEIENVENRHIAFNKRILGLKKKVRELSVMCDSQIGIIIFSDTGKLTEYSTPGSSMKQIITRYMTTSQSKIDTDHEFQNSHTKWEEKGGKTGLHNVLSFLKITMEEELDGWSNEQLQQLEDDLEMWTSIVRNKKNKVALDKIRTMKQEREKAVSLGRQYESILRLQKRSRPTHAILEVENGDKGEDPVLCNQFWKYEFEDSHGGNCPPSNGIDHSLRKYFKEQATGPQLELGLNLQFDVSMESSIPTNTWLRSEKLELAQQATFQDLYRSKC